MHVGIRGRCLISASVADVTTFLIVEHVIWIRALVLIVAVGVLVSTNHPEARNLTSSCTRYAASVSNTRIMSLVWYRSVAS